MSDSRTNGLTLNEVLLYYSVTGRLSSNILKGVGRNYEGDGKEKGGLKVHVLIDKAQSVAIFVKITAAKLTEQKLLKNLEMPIIIKSGVP